MHPRVKVTVDGKAVAGTFYERLVSITISDKDGDSADTVDIELNDGSPDFLSIPRKGGIIDVMLGYSEQGMRSLGQFTVDKVAIKCLPYSLSVSGKAADLRSGKLKQRMERHWDKKTLGDVVKQIAGEAGLSPAIDPELAKVPYPWLGQQDETSIHFLRRLADRHGALFSVKNRRLIFAKKGSGNSASGAFVGSVIVTPTIIVPGSCTVEANDRTKYSKVVAYYQDSKEAKRREIEVSGDAEGDSVYRIPEPFASVDEADKAASAKAEDLKRGEGSGSVSVIGDTGICAGAPLMFSGVRPGVDGAPYIIDTATHRYNKTGGYTTDISFKLYDGKSGGGSSGSAGDGTAGGTAGSAAADKVAPNATEGTPATPSKWTSAQRLGKTDSN